MQLYVCTYLCNYEVTFMQTVLEDVEVPGAHIVLL